MSISPRVLTTAKSVAPYALASALWGFGDSGVALDPETAESLNSLATMGSSGIAGNILGSAAWDAIKSLSGGKAAMTVNDPAGELMTAIDESFWCCVEIYEDRSTRKGNLYPVSDSIRELFNERKKPKETRYRIPFLADPECVERTQQLLERGEHSECQNQLVAQLSGSPSCPLYEMRGPGIDAFSRLACYYMPDLLKSKIVQSLTLANLIVLNITQATNRDIKAVENLLQSLGTEAAQRGASFLDALGNEIQQSSQAILDAMADEHAPRLRLEQRRTHHEKLTDASQVSIDLFHFKEQWLDFLGREEELVELRRFIESGDRFRWWAIVGDGGCGKSRLAQHLAHELIDEGWEAGFISSESDRHWGSFLSNYEKWKPQKPTLLLIDYAVKRSDDIPTMLKHFHERGAKGLEHPVRVLFIDRRGSFGPWFSDLGLRRGQTDSEETRIDSIAGMHRRPDHKEKADTGKHPQDEDFLFLKPLDTYREGRSFFEQTLAQLSYASDLPAEDAFWEQLERITDNGRPLYLQLAAVIFVQKGIEFFDTTNTLGLVDELIRIERGVRWKNLFKDDPKLLPVVEKTVGFITLCRGLDIVEYKDTVASAAGVDASNELIMGIQRVLPRKTEKVVAPLAPDLLGERFLLVGGDPDAASDCGIPPFDISKWIVEALTANPSGLAETLRLLADDFPEESRNPVWIEKTLRLLADEERYPDEYAAQFCDGLIPTFVARIPAVDGQWVAVRNALLGLALTRGAAAAAVAGVTQGWTVATRLAGVAPFDKHWLDRLDGIRSCRTSNRVFCVRLAMAAANALKHYFQQGEQANDEVARWEAKLRRVATQEQFKNDKDIQLKLAVAAVDALNHYIPLGEEANDEVARWEATLREVAGERQFKTDEDIQRTLALAAHDALVDYIPLGEKAQDEVARWEATLRKVAGEQQFKSDKEIQLRLANAASNALIDYIPLGEKAQDEIARWEATLRRVAAEEQFKSDKDIQLTLAMAAVDALIDYIPLGEKAQDEIARWEATLRRVAAEEQFKSDKEIQLTLVKAAFHALHHYRPLGEKAYDEVVRWEDTLREVVGKQQFKTDKEIQLTLVKAAFHALHHYRPLGEEAQDEIARWEDTLREALEDPWYTEEDRAALREQLKTNGAVLLPLRVPQRLELMLDALRDGEAEAGLGIEVEVHDL